MVRLYALAVLLALASVASSAEDQRNIVTVDGTAEVKYRPDTVTLYFSVTGTSEGAKEAEKKHADKVRRVKEALVKVGIKEEEMTSDGVSIQTGVMKGSGNEDRWGGGGGGGSTELPKVSVQSSLKIVRKGLKTDVPDETIKTVAAIIDAALEAGVDNTASRTYNRYRGEYVYSSNNPTALFSIDEAKTATLRAEATAKAAADARAKAEHLAKSLGRKVGKATTVWPPSGHNPRRSSNDDEQSQTEMAAGQTLSADALKEFTFPARIVVSFELVD